MLRSSVTRLATRLRPPPNRAMSLFPPAHAAPKPAVWWPKLAAIGTRPMLCVHDYFMDMRFHFDEHELPGRHFPAAGEMPTNVSLMSALELNFEPFELPPAAPLADEPMQAMPKRTWQPNRLKRRRSHGFLKCVANRQTSARSVCVVRSPPPSLYAHSSTLCVLCGVQADEHEGG